MRQRLLVPVQRLARAACPPQQVGPDRRHRARPRQPRIVGHARRVRRDPPGTRRETRWPARDWPVPRVSRRSQQSVVGRTDRRPVGLLPTGRRRVDRGDHRLRQVRSRRARGQLQALQAVGDPAAVPSATVLLVERHQCAIGVHAGRVAANHAAGQGRPAPARRASRASTCTAHRRAGRLRRTARRGSPTVLPSTSSPR